MVLLSYEYRDRQEVTPLDRVATPLKVRRGLEWLRHVELAGS